MSQPAEKEKKDAPNPAPAATPAGTAPAPENELALARKRIEELEAQVKEKESKYLYLYAEGENFKKRTAKERADLLKYGWENMAHDLLEVLDNMQRALGHLPAGTDKNLASGLNMILNQLKTALQKQGIQEIPAQGQPFDPNVHEAVAHEPAPQVEGTVIREHNKGYMLHGRLLRPARVTVSAGNTTKQ